MGNHHLIVLVLMMMMMASNGVENGIREVGIRVILDMDSNVGRSTRICILMALEDFYGARHNNFTTIIHPHFRDSKFDNFRAASAAIELRKNTQVMAFFGPQQSSQAIFVLDIVNTFKLLVISSATSPYLSSKQNPYFIRIAQNSSTQAEPIAALIKSFGWREVVLVFEDTDFGRGPIPYLFDAMGNIGTKVKYRTLVSPSSSDNTLMEQLYKLKTMKTRVFVVHMLPALATRFFKKAHELGMMAPGYAWIITDVLTGLLSHLDHQDLDYMQGVLGVKPYIPPSNHLTSFERKWRTRFHKEYPNMPRIELDMLGIWSYDSIFALAGALERVENDPSTNMKIHDLAAIETSELGSKLLPLIQNTRFKGLSGDFHIVDGQLQTLAYQIVNVIGNGEKHIGFWNSMTGLSKQTRDNQKLEYTTSKDILKAIIWPGDTPKIPKGSDDKKLRVGVPALSGFVEFMEAYRDPITDIVYSNGFCIDVFCAVIDAMPYVVKYEFVPYENPDGESSGNIDDLVYQIALGKLDMVVGDVAILWNRSNYVDFTLPFSELGVGMLVPVKDEDRKNEWIFMKPLETKLWITIGVLFIYTGLVVWVLEHRINIEFRDTPNQQVGMIFWFIFSTLVSTHKEKMTSNLSRFVVIVWIFVVLVLTSSYTASLSSMLTVQGLQPTVTNIYELKAKGEYVSFQDGSFVEGILKNMGFRSDKSKKYDSFKEYENALSDGSGNNGVSAIVDGTPYLKMLQAKYCNKYLIVGGQIYNTAGFGFALPKGSPQVAEFSKAISKVVEREMRNISNKWFGNEAYCPGENGQTQSFNKLKLASFKYLFLIAGLSSTYALVAYITTFLYENKEILASQGSIRQKMNAFKQRFFVEKYKKSIGTQTINYSHVLVEENTMETTPSTTSTQTISDQPQGEGVLTALTSNVEHQGEGDSISTTCGPQKSRGLAWLDHWHALTTSWIRSLTQNFMHCVQENPNEHL